MATGDTSSTFAPHLTLQDGFALRGDLRTMQDDLTAVLGEMAVGAVVTGPDVMGDDGENNDWDVDGGADEYDDDDDVTGMGQKQRSVQERLHTDSALYPLTVDESTTYQAMLQRDVRSEIFVTPNHHIDVLGNMRGFRLVVSRESDCSGLPVVREMFFGTTCVECGPGDGVLHPDVIKLLNNTAWVKERMAGVLREIAENRYKTAGFDCMPVHADDEVTAVTIDDPYSAKQRNEILFENLYAERLGRHSAMARGRDGKEWCVDMPCSVGVYHAHVRSRDTNRRHHKLFVIVSGGCRRASEQYYNMVIDLLGNATAVELATCEESWWLRGVNTRNRCYIAQKFAEALGLNVDARVDQHAHLDDVLICDLVSDSIRNDIKETDDGRVALFNECVDTVGVDNGILCGQNPSEGVWVFQGSQKGSVGEQTNFGGGFGNEDTCGAFPSGTYPLTADKQLVGVSSRRRKLVQPPPTPAAAAAAPAEPAPVTESDGERDGERDASHDTGYDGDYDAQQEADAVDAFMDMGDASWYTLSSAAMQSASSRRNFVQETPSQHTFYFDPVSGCEVESKSPAAAADRCMYPRYVKMDESFIQNLENSGWLRHYGIVELIPIMVAQEVDR